MLKNPIVDEYDLSSLEIAVFGAAPIKPETERALKNKFKLKYVQQLYGMTETTLAITCQASDISKSGTVGPPLPGTQMKVSRCLELY